MALLLRWKGLKPRSRWAILAFNTVLFLGIVYRKQFTSTLVTSYFSIIAILIIYLSAQNPDMYRDKITFLFSRSAFDLIVTEFLNKNIPFHMVAVTVDNYESARSIYGYAELTTSLREIGSWLVEALTSYRVFYFDNGNYLLMGVGDPDESKGTAERGIATLNERFQEFWKDIDTDIGLSLSALYIPSDMVPYCPVCGEPMDINIRKDSFFVEDDKWHEMSDRYYDFLNGIEGKFVFLEIGVGFNTPTIIRFPFEQMTYNNDDATLIRLNLDYPQAIEENKDKTISFDENVEEILDYWLSRV